MVFLSPACRISDWHRWQPQYRLLCQPHEPAHALIYRNSILTEPIDVAGACHVPSLRRQGFGIVPFQDMSHMMSNWEPGFPRKSSNHMCWVSVLCGMAKPKTISMYKCAQCPGSCFWICIFLDMFYVPYQHGFFRCNNKRQVGLQVSVFLGFFSVNSTVSFYKHTPRLGFKY